MHARVAGNPGQAIPKPGNESSWISQLAMNDGDKGQSNSKSNLTLIKTDKTECSSDARRMFFSPMVLLLWL